MTSMSWKTRRSIPAPQGDRVHVELSGPPQTMLDMVYAKALDADSDRPILGDTYAKKLISQVDYDPRTSPITKQRRRQVSSITVRGAQFDIWVREFLQTHERAVVLHLGCGLDSRVFRVDPGPGVEWFDVDFPDVIALREQFYPTRDRYHLVAASVTDPAWLDDIPTDRPVLLLAEGVSMYLQERDGVALLRRVVERFPAGELQLDFWSRFGTKAMRKNNTVVRWSGSTLGWSVDGPEDILRAVPGVRVVKAISIFDAETAQRLPRGLRRFTRVASHTPVLRKLVGLHRYAF
ncbi:class I SAM-dependent methyltransferase [Mycolicibacterium litorale]|uniref:O-methyltransferase n=1 Tax=Mycolicibacterium litorale TaxID=758802 RepID=A0AAD1ILR5_9MYCO|nr:class I SAM-dependent methyltransferase [Mycolicibacterium litorale]MCV7413695.1 class I SAM-dependent methyltransferase [Mycolicibacterium litorale]TDY11597.1 O-methyltransferase involved in polyketide biosynthesis [Mycolicibacterium litorale]BBY15877.1 putative O-methyltransferase [Mycolicibacterium litorale]